MSILSLTGGLFGAMVDTSLIDALRVDSERKITRWNNNSQSKL